MDNTLVKVETIKVINLINYVRSFHPLRIIEGEKSFAFIDYYSRMINILAHIEQTPFDISLYSMTIYQINTISGIMENIEQIELLELEE